MKRIDGLVRQIWGILLIYGGLVQLIGMWFVKDRFRFTVGLWIGIGLAVFMIWHMHRALDAALDMDEGGARKKSISMYVIRLIVVLAVFLVTYYLNFGNVIATFIGVMGLKIAAYMQPILMQSIQKRNKKGR